MPYERKVWFSALLVAAAVHPGLINGPTFIAIFGISQVFQSVAFSCHPTTKLSANLFDKKKDRRMGSVMFVKAFLSCRKGFCVRSSAQLRRPMGI